MLVGYVVGGIERLLDEGKMREGKTVLGVLSIMIESSDACRRVFVGIDQGFVKTLLNLKGDVQEERFEIVMVLYGSLMAVTWNCLMYERR